MPNSFLPPVQQGCRGAKEGAILLGDSWNMRHPLTGGGMTVALHDVVILTSLIGAIPDLSDWEEVKQALYQWHWVRKPLSATVNILSVALCDLFSADGGTFFSRSLTATFLTDYFMPADEELAVLRTGCFKYFERGGECVNGPVSLLSGSAAFLFSVISTHGRLHRIAPSPLLLAYHFFSVAFYSIWVLFTHPKPISPDMSASNGGKPVYTVATIDQYPLLALKSVRVVCHICNLSPSSLESNSSLSFPVLDRMYRIWPSTVV